MLVKKEDYDSTITCYVIRTFKPMYQIRDHHGRAVSGLDLASLKKSPFVWPCWIFVFKGRYIGPKIAVFWTKKIGFSRGDHGSGSALKKLPIGREKILCPKPTISGQNKRTFWAGQNNRLKTHFWLGQSKKNRTFAQTRPKIGSSRAGVDQLKHFRLVWSQKNRAKNSAQAWKNSSRSS